MRRYDYASVGPQSQCLVRPQRLRELVRSAMGFSAGTVFFRTNATHCYMDVQLSLLYAPEREPDLVVLSSHDHPVILAASARHGWRTDTRFVQTRETTLKRYGYAIALSNAAGLARRPLFVVSQVLWVTGEVVDIRAVGKVLKRKHPSCRIIVDAAQAFANVALPRVQQKWIQRNCDAYFTSAHKWLDCQSVMGVGVVFGRLSSRQATILMEKDILGSFAAPWNFGLPEDTYDGKAAANLMEAVVSMKTRLLCTPQGLDDLLSRCGLAEPFRARVLDSKDRLGSSRLVCLPSSERETARARAELSARLGLLGAGATFIASPTGNVYLRVSLPLGRSDLKKAVRVLVDFVGWRRA